MYRSGQSKSRCFGRRALIPQSKTESPTVSEIRLYVTTGEKEATRILDAMTEEADYEEFAVATTEIDEKKNVWEASVYCLADDEDEVGALFQATVSGLYPDLVVAREVIRTWTGSPSRSKG